MYKLTIFCILLLLSSIVRSECAQAEIAGRWDYVSHGFSCKFILTETGVITKAACELPQFMGSGGPLHGRHTGELKVNKYCKLEGEISIGSDQEISQPILIWGRVVADKLTAHGQAFSSYNGYRADVPRPEGFASFSMVRY
jgi:hypothetical protein